ncbi:hypothetical protein F5146DRAFT_421243 [Armillaria mellea]|nr:hypothetical protein F5146DRAFT_421243 [Armillaria mellea]
MALSLSRAGTSELSAHHVACAIITFKSRRCSLPRSASELVVSKTCRAHKNRRFLSMAWACFQHTLNLPYRPKVLHRICLSPLPHRRRQLCFPRIPASRYASQTCLIVALKQLFKGSYTADWDKSLFPSHDDPSKPSSWSFFISAVCDALSEARYDPSLFAEHSFRRRDASAAAAAGRSSYEIQLFRPLA